MNCLDVHNKLFDYADGTLADNEREWVSQHLERCDKCRAMVARLKNVHALIGAERSFSPSPGFTSFVMNEISGSKQFTPIRKTELLQWRNWVAAASVALCIWAGYATGNWYTSSIGTASTDEITWLDDASLEMMDVMYNE